MNKELLSQYNPERGTQMERIENPRYRLLIFDFHGTVTDHQLRAIAALHRAGHKAFGIHLPKPFYQEVLTRPSHVAGKGMTNAEFINQKFVGQYPQDMVEEFLRVHKEQMDLVYKPIPGIKYVLRTLTDNDIKIAFLTNGSNREPIQQVLVRWGFPRMAENLYSSHITGVKKPDTRAVTKILEDCKDNGEEFHKNQILMIGDYKDDIKTAHNLGIDSVLVTRGNGWEVIKVREPRPTYIITDPFDIIRIVKGEVSPYEGDFYNIVPLLWRKENWGRKAA
jgi:FMN phosphatase YigB (HAD superfamily)